MKIFKIDYIIINLIQQCLWIIWLTKNKNYREKINESGV
jgi:hypothetical protein